MLAGDVAARDARAALERVLASTEFASATRLAAFLRYVVTESLEGRAANLKGYSIAVDVFDRPPDFDQTADPIVRVEASRLRRALAQYYQGSGSGDPVIIDLPRGGYVPNFRRRDTGPPVAAEPAEETIVPARPQSGPISEQERYPKASRFRLIMVAAVVLALGALSYLVYVAAKLELGAPQVTGEGPTPAAPVQAIETPEGRFQPVIAVMPLENL
ncbi:MAG: hypothetical protein JNL98_42035, partial [Bryobacterales bacterium]|nr:hypothetical protein [Bryobacterales bacterium]